MAGAPSRGVLRRLKGGAEILGLTVLAALTLKTFVVDAVLVPSASMENTILAGDFLLVDKVAFGGRTPRSIPFTTLALPVLRLPGLASPRRGDVIVFDAPDAPAGVRYVKRLAALPGDTVRLRGGVLSVDGRPVERPPTAKGWEGDSPDFGPVGVPAGSCFVLGDNLDESLDSRSWGFVPLESIVGRAFLVYWSIAPGGSIRWRRTFTLIR